MSESVSSSDFTTRLCEGTLPTRFFRWQDRTEKELRESERIVRERGGEWRDFVVPLWWALPGVCRLQEIMRSGGRF